jgi:hypothetical protein
LEADVQRFHPRARRVLRRRTLALSGTRAP